MDNVRVLLANSPRMLRESLQGLLDRQNDIEVATAPPDPIELLSAVDRTEADVVLVTLPESGADPGICSHLLAQYPELLVIAVSPVDGRAVVFKQVITREELRPVAEDDLLKAIRRRREQPFSPAATPNDRLGTVPQPEAEETFPRKKR